MSSTAKRPNRSVLPPNPARLNRFQFFIERAAAHFTRKPNHVNAVRQGKALPIHERQLAENMALIAQGYSPTEIIAALEAVIMEIEDATDARATQRGAFLSLVDTYQELIEAEGRAAPVQNRATVTGEVGDLDHALELSAYEIAKEKAHWRAMKRRRDTLALMRNQMPSRPLAS